MAEALFPLVSVAILVLTVGGIVWRGRDKRWVRDAQLALNAQPLLSLIPAAFLALGAVALAILGFGSLAAGFAPGWGFFPLALEALVIIGFTVWIARCPFPAD
ncbi:hypothetical protein DEI81_02420 [Curtobacterium sp. MCBD17_013]|uniref:hypothetical protein n=1 Tax=Curtobacterium sp. MCBD17_013 TaxID=2175668 RepID=UPI000DA80674|nr:hypothetical protein [Curtobacterium sp. MCBD17_013]PZF66471.1 hypothetical protein DEI81_02420 [Curtobacterium sp. MCBD17_013]